MFKISPTKHFVPRILIHLLGDLLQKGFNDAFVMKNATKADMSLGESCGERICMYCIAHYYVFL